MAKNSVQKKKNDIEALIIGQTLSLNFGWYPLDKGKIFSFFTFFHPLVETYLVNSAKLCN